MTACSHYPIRSFEPSGRMRDEARRIAVNIAKLPGKGDSRAADEALIEIAKSYNVSHMTISKL